MAEDLMLVKVLYSIGQELAQQQDRQLTLNRIVEAAVYLAGADEGSLFLKDLDSDEVRRVAHRGAGESDARAVNELTEGGLVSRVLGTGAPLMLSAQGAAEVGAPAAAVLALPLSVRERSLGVLQVAHAEADGAFTQDHLYKLSILAAYAAVIVENANLRAEIEQEVERTAIFQIGASFSSTLRLDAVLDMVMQVAVRLVDAERGYVVLMDEQRSGYAPRAAYALDLAMFGSDEFRPERQVIHRVLRENTPVRTIVDSIVRKDGSRTLPRAVMCIPIAGASGLTGAIYVDHRDRLKYFQLHHQEMLAVLAGNAAVSIENARLFNQVEAERRKLEAVLRGTDQPVIVADVDRRIVLMNSAARRSFAAKQAKGTGLLFQQAIDHPNLSYLFDQAEASGRVQHGEILVDGGQTFSATVTPVSGVGFVAVMQDITEFAKLSQMKSEFVATVSHDLRSPLSTVQGFLSVLGQAGPLTEQQQDFVDSAQQEVTRLMELTSDLLDLGRLEANIDLEMERCDIGHIVSQSMEHAQPLAIKKQLTLDADVPSDPVHVMGNAGLLWQMADNLIGNAIKYTLNGGRVSVQLAREGQEVVLRVKDTGIGIRSEDQPHVFDRFFRGDNDQVRDIEGTGLGLAIVKSIVDRHGGRVWLESELGEGSTFEVVLPSPYERDTEA